MKLSECKGDWVLVTGASSGIGEEFCSRLSAAGMNIIMVARREQLLNALSEKLKAQHGIRTLVLPLDLSQPGSALKVKELTARENIKIRLLVNNAGFGPWGSFEKTPSAAYEQIVHLVAATPISLCHLFLSDLTSFDNSAIINLSSPAALQPVPYLAVYSAAKACLHNFSLALYGEWKDRGITIQTLVPGPTATEFDVKGGAYMSALGEVRRPASEIVNASLSSLDRDLPLVTTNRGIYKQRVFAGVAPIKMVVREVKKMFAAPHGR